MRNLLAVTSVAGLAVFLSACGGGSQNTALAPPITNDHLNRAKLATSCTTVTDSTGATYSVAQIGGGNNIDVEYSSRACQIGIYINGKNGSPTLDHTMVNGAFNIGIYFDNAGNGAHEDHTQICVNGSNPDGACNTGTGSSPGTGLDIRNTPKLAIDHTSIDGYAAGYATNGCPNTGNQLSADHTAITNATYPWSYEGGNNNFNYQSGHDSPAFQGNSCNGSAVGVGIPTLFVANGSGQTIEGYVAPYSYSFPVLSLTSDLNIPLGLALDANGNLYAANFNGNNVTIFDPPFTDSSSPSVIMSNDDMSGPEDVAFDARGDLFVANYSNSTVAIYKSPFSSSELPFAIVTNGIAAPVGVAVDSSGNLYVANVAASTITIYAPPFTGSPTTITNGLSNPFGLAFDSSGRLFAANSANGTVVIYDSPFGSTSSPAVTLTVPTSAEYLAFDAAGNLYVTVFDDNAVAIFAPSFTTSSKPVSYITNGIAGPTGIAIAAGAGSSFRKHPHPKRLK